MARQANVEAVLAAIASVYSKSRATRPSKAEIIAESGVAHKTFYRVLQDHPDAKRQLELAEAVFDHRPLGEPSKPDPDPLKADPHGAVSELLDTIAKLTVVIESQRKRIRTLEKQIGTAPTSITEPKLGRPAAPLLCCPWTPGQSWFFLKRSAQKNVASFDFYLEPQPETESKSISQNFFEFISEANPFQVKVFAAFLTPKHSVS
jgi:hypothetical protein